MKSTAPFKRGDTFSLACTWKVSGVPTALTGLVIASQVRTQAGLKLVASLQTVPADQGLTPGLFTLLAGDTANWPIGNLVCDIEITQDGIVRSSESFLIPVVDGVTQ